jgi:hypothetical protein
MNCYKCKHSCPIPGDAHLSCNCPPLNDDKAKAGIALYVMAGSITGIETFGITFNQHGVESGWCNWPMKFDPVWIKGECKMFKEK